MVATVSGLRRYPVVVLVGASSPEEAVTVAGQMGSVVHVVKVAADDDATVLTGPGGSVVIDRARFERLREYITAHIAYVDDPDYMKEATGERMGNAERAIQPGDLDPLP